jgi:dTDP-4-dehydrorhamnose reductase
MKVLILGGSGMLGHKLWQVLARRFDTYVTLRQSFNHYRRYNLFDPDHTLEGVSVEDFDSVVRAIDKVQPNDVVNCIGIVKQVEKARDPLTSIAINALFPHQLAQLCLSRGFRLIQISTDCVFSGRQGNYTEDDLPDAEDLYGKTKFLGEVSHQGCLTIRTSMVGRELETSYGLVEWFLGQAGNTVSGYSKAIFSGLTTNSLAEVIGRIIAEHSDMQGVWHVASEPISKFGLLSLIKELYRLDVQIDRDETVVYNRSLNAERFRRATGFVPPPWNEMIEQMYLDPTKYTELRRPYAKR